MIVIVVTTAIIIDIVIVIVMAIVVVPVIVTVIVIVIIIDIVIVIVIATVKVTNIIITNLSAVLFWAGLKQHSALANTICGVAGTLSLSRDTNKLLWVDCNEKMDKNSKPKPLKIEWLFFSACLSVSLSFSQSANHFSIRQTVSQSVCLSVCPSDGQSVYLADWLTNCASVCLWLAA